MSAKSLLRAGIASPRAPRSPSTPRSILKRPPALPLSTPFRTKVTVTLSPGPCSPHVHFPPSPSLTATFTTHSPNSYDRGAIPVSPNPLQLPSWGARVYSPGSDSFAKLLSPNNESCSSAEEELTPKFKTFAPPMLSLNSPTSNQVFPESPTGVDMTPTTRAGARFQAIASQASIRPATNSLAGALKAYPRSPYPSAPVQVSTPASPAPAVLADKEVTSIIEGTGANTVGVPPSRTKTIHGYGSNPLRVSRTKKVPPAITVITRPPYSEAVSSPLRSEYTTPVQEHTATAANAATVTVAKPVVGNGPVADDASSDLTQAFWQSMTLDNTVDMSSPYITTEDPVASGLLSPDGMISPMIFANKDGAVWSPPKPETWKKTVREFRRKPDSPRGKLMSPSPEDPFSAFPSFAAVLSLNNDDVQRQEFRGMDKSMIIAYPPPVVTVESTSSSTGSIAFAGRR